MGALGFIPVAILIITLLSTGNCLLNCSAWKPKEKIMHMFAYIVKYNTEPTPNSKPQDILLPFTPSLSSKPAHGRVTPWQEPLYWWKESDARAWLQKPAVCDQMVAWSNGNVIKNRLETGGTLLHQQTEQELSLLSVTALVDGCKMQVNCGAWACWSSYKARALLSLCIFRKLWREMSKIFMNWSASNSVFPKREININLMFFRDREEKKGLCSS